MGLPAAEQDVLDRTKLVHIIKESENAKEVDLLDVRLTTMSSLNYSGEIVFCDLKAAVDGAEREFRWAVKLPPFTSKERMPLHRETKMEEKEIVFYREILPAWKNLMRERKAEFSINCYESPYSEYHEDWQEGGSILVLQDLRTHDFKDGIDKKWGLDLYHSKLAMEELAKFHALGYAYLKSYPGGTKEGLERNKLIARDYCISNPSAMAEAVIEPMNKMAVANMVTVLKSVQEPGQDFAGAFMKAHAKADIFDMSKRLFGADMEGFKTICHGDAQLNNLLFK